jgi:uncharacterized protein (TIGR03435 family)
MQGVYGNMYPMIMRGGPGTSSPGEVSFKNASLMSILTSTFDVKRYQVSGPPWLGTLGFNIVAKVPPGATKDQIKLMMRNLLAERFQLAVHRETRDLPAFALVVAKGGPKLTAAQHPEDGGGSFGPWKGNAREEATNQTMHGLADFLTMFMERPVMDATGLAGKYDFTLYWAPEYPMVRLAPKTQGAEAEAPDPAPTIFAAVQDQLGLKLEPRKMPVEFLVIDHMEKTPTEN